MDLLAIMSSLRRHWVITVAITLLTLIGGFAVLSLAPRVYHSNASFVLVNPRPQPTGPEILADPSLTDVNWDNPYLRFASEGTVGQVLAARLSSESVRQALAGQGADPGYAVLQSPVSAQIIDVVGTGSSPTRATTTLELVNRRMAEELVGMQKVYGADDRTLITLLPVAPPAQPYLIVSGTIRTLVGVGAAGVLLLFAAISLAEAHRHAREEAADTAAAGTGRHGTHRAGARRRSGTHDGTDILEPAARSDVADLSPEPTGAVTSRGAAAVETPDRRRAAAADFWAPPVARTDEGTHTEGLEREPVGVPSATRTMHRES